MARVVHCTAHDAVRVCSRFAAGSPHLTDFTMCELDPDCAYKFRLLVVSEISEEALLRVFRKILKRNFGSSREKDVVLPEVGFSISSSKCVTAHSGNEQSFADMDWRQSACAPNHTHTCGAHIGVGSSSSPNTPEPCSCAGGGGERLM